MWNRKQKRGSNCSRFTVLVMFTRHQRVLQRLQYAGTKKIFSELNVSRIPCVRKKKKLEAAAACSNIGQQISSFLMHQWFIDEKRTIGVCGEVGVSQWVGVGVVVEMKRKREESWKCESGRTFFPDLKFISTQRFFFKRWRKFFFFLEFFWN